jgi:hypothetical protein
MHLHAQGGHTFWLRRRAFPLTCWPDVVGNLAADDQRGFGVSEAYQRRGRSILTAILREEKLLPLRLDQLGSSLREAREEENGALVVASGVLECAL